MSGKSDLKAVWTPANHKIFVDLCLEETLKGNKPGSHFTKEGWSNMVESFKKKAGLRYDKKKLKNHWDLTKRKWKVWLKLTSDFRMKWDPNSCKFGACGDEWAKYIQENPEAAEFQFKELQFADKLQVIFYGIVDAEDMVLASCRKRLHCSSASSHSHSEENVTEMIDEEYDGTALERDGKNQSRHSYGQSVSGSSLPKVKATWAPVVHEIFVDLCLEETLKGNKPGTHFTKAGWKNIVESFHQRTDLKYSRLQLKNHWDNTKEQWKVWGKLIGTSSMKWDPNTNQLSATEEDWTTYLQESPEASQFRFKELPCADKLDAIFNGTSFFGETVSPIQQWRYDENLTEPMLFGEQPNIVQPEGSTPFTPEYQTMKEDKHDREAERLCDPVESGNAETMQKSAVTFPGRQGKQTYSIGECIDCLDEMEEVEQGSELYLFALDLFLKKEYREIFLQLKKPTVRILWLQRLQLVSQPSQ
ncbi:hypothetical protein UlMin_025505 [Ulmus minor]